MSKYIPKDKYGFNKATQIEYPHLRKRNNMHQQSSPYTSPSKKCTNRTLSRCCYSIILITFVYLQVQVPVTLPKARKLSMLKCSRWYDMNCIEHLWKGDAVAYLPTNREFEVSLVISSCGEDIDLFMSYLNDVKYSNIKIKSTVIVSGCAPPSNEILPNDITVTKSNWDNTEIHAIEWLTELLRTSQLQKSLPNYYYQNNTFILFLNEKSWEEGKIRTLDDVLEATMETGFGCVQRPADGMSYYHNGQMLRSFATGNKENYKNYGHWLINLKATSIHKKKFVPVCYGSSFAVLSQDLLTNASSHYPLMMDMLANFEVHGSEVSPFIERSIAAMFSYQLPEEKIVKLKKYNTGIETSKHRLGSFLHNFRNSYLYNFFLGDTLEDKKIPENLRLSLVVSHCDENMAWIKDFIDGYETQDVTIYSKCNSTITGYLHPRSKVIELPNYGRCDHSYANWMANMEEDATEDHLVLFLKASRVSRFHYQMNYRALTDMIRIAIANGFACGYQNKEIYYHDTQTLRKFNIATHKGQNIKSPYYSDLGDYLDVIGIKLPTPIVPVCYGGNFAVMASQIYPQRVLLKRMEETMTRGDSIEEGHFAERIWAGLFSYSLNYNETDVLQSLPTKTSEDDVAGYFGSLHLNGL